MIILYWVCDIWSFGLCYMYCVYAPGCPSQTHVSRNQEILFSTSSHTEQLYCPSDLDTSSCVHRNQIVSGITVVCATTNQNDNMQKYIT